MYFRSWIVLFFEIVLQSQSRIGFTVSQNIVISLSRHIRLMASHGYHTYVTYIAWMHMDVADFAQSNASRAHQRQASTFARWPNQACWSGAAEHPRDRWGRRGRHLVRAVGDRPFEFHAVANDCSSIRARSTSTADANACQAWNQWPARQQRAQGLAAPLGGG